jgi:hypothetical protein
MRGFKLKDARSTSSSPSHGELTFPKPFPSSGQTLELGAGLGLLVKRLNIRVLYDPLFHFVNLTQV